MLTGGQLLKAGAGAARRQAWAFIPLYVAAVLGRLLGLMPTLTLAARFVRAGKLQGTSDLMGAYLVGLISDLDNPAPWAAWAAGSLIALVGGWLLSVVLQAGVLRLLAAQARTAAPADEDAFSDGVLRAPANYLLTAALAEALKFMLFACALGAFIGAEVYFSENPGAIAALGMTFATCALLTLPFLVAALELGFARAVILEEPPAVAMGEGILLFARGAFAFVPPWYLLKLVGIAVTFFGAVAAFLVSAMPGDHDLWILRLGPSAMVTLLAVAATTAIAFLQLGVNAALVVVELGPLPSAPTMPEPVLMAVAIGPDEPILIAREIPPAAPPSDDEEPGKLP